MENVLLPSPGTSVQPHPSRRAGMSRFATEWCSDISACPVLAFPGALVLHRRQQKCCYSRGWAFSVRPSSAGSPVQAGPAAVVTAWPQQHLQAENLSRAVQVLYFEKIMSKSENLSLHPVSFVALSRRVINVALFHVISVSSRKGSLPIAASAVLGSWWVFFTWKELYVSTLISA